MPTHTPATVLRAVVTYLQSGLLLGSLDQAHYVPLYPATVQLSPEQPLTVSSTGGLNT